MESEYVETLKQLQTMLTCGSKGSLVDPEKTAEELLRTALSSTEMHTRPDFLHREMRKYTTPRSRSLANGPADSSNHASASDARPGQKHESDANLLSGTSRDEGTRRNTATGDVPRSTNAVLRSTDPRHSAFKDITTFSVLETNGSSQHLPLPPSVFAEHGFNLPEALERLSAAASTLEVPRSSAGTLQPYHGSRSESHCAVREAAPGEVRRRRVANTSEAPAVEEAARERVELRGANHKERAAREAQTFASSEGFARDALQTRYENEALVLTVSSPTRNSNNKRASHESQRNQLGQMEFALQIKPTGQINLEMFSRGQSRDEGLTELDLSGYDANLDKFDVMKFKAKDKNPNL
ncbi:hypothetical protein CYMTET_9480 [Cymbomonas tetramitiformis]|uniref:Uncharacterized protein n=1 Tax=Cymbomonas tetramitiformis TaxID=36881 RepID=A0AAE0LEU1_9CHLO|nr:hypothetical protein CYMTET_9480 [Cymbomonas tetramitiformis]